MSASHGEISFKQTKLSQHSKKILSLRYLVQASRMWDSDLVEPCEAYIEVCTYSSCLVDFRSRNIRGEYLGQFCWICAVSLSAPLTIMVHSVANYRPNLNRIWWYSTHPITENFKSLLTRSNTSSTSTLAYYYKGVPLPCKDTLCSRREAVKFYLIWSVDSLKNKSRRKTLGKKCVSVWTQQAHLFTKPSSYCP